jgi:quinol monooxygenase YgiN
MIKRIVKMEFRPDEVENFKVLFDTVKHKIRHFEGCMHLQLWQDVNTPSVFFTYSFWSSVEHLEKYRKSDLFKEVWSHTKAKFADKPMAWSVDVLHELK